MEKVKEKAIVLLSGGMDSLAVAAIANEKHKEMLFLHLNYNQKTHLKERDCFYKISDFYQVPLAHRKIIDMSFLGQIGGSSLTDVSMNVTEFAGDSDEIPTSYVPFRNTHIIALAVSWAEVMGATKIYMGANEEDSPGYPDCRQEYFDVYNKLIEKGTSCSNIEIVTPIIQMKKSEIIQVAIDKKAPLNLSWSCYKNTDEACGTCDSCAIRLRGFKDLGIKDPIKYL